MKDWYNTILLLVSSTIAITLKDFFVGKGFPALVSLVVAAVIGLLIYKLTQLIFLELPMHSRRIRHYLDPASRFEGHWLSKAVNMPGGSISYIVIDYNPNSKEYRYDGSAYDQEVRKKGYWRSTMVKIDLTQNELWFFCRDYLTDEDHKDDDYVGSGFVHFEADDTGRFTSGNGRFVDAGIELAQGKTVLTRIEKEQVKNLLGKPSITSDKDREDFIKAYLGLPENT